MKIKSRNNWLKLLAFAGATSAATEAFAQPASANWPAGRPFDAIVAGKDNDGTALSPCRANHSGGVHPGKTRAGWNYCDIGFGGQEVGVTSYQTLTAPWSSHANGSVPDNAKWFGAERSDDSVPSAPGVGLHPCRAFLSDGSYQLGKVRAGLGACLVPYGGSEISVSNYQVLTDQGIPFREQSVSNQTPPYDALVGGYDSDGTTLYVCAANVQGSKAPGKVRKGSTSCNVGYGGTEFAVNDYKVLVPAFSTPPEVVFQAGNESDQSTLGVCRAAYGSGLQVGKYLQDGHCNFGFAGSEISVASGFEVLSSRPPVP